MTIKSQTALNCMTILKFSRVSSFGFPILDLRFFSSEASNFRRKKNTRIATIETAIEQNAQNPIDPGTFNFKIYASKFNNDKFFRDLVDQNMAINNEKPPNDYYEPDSYLLPMKLGRAMMYELPKS